MVGMRRFFLSSRFGSGKRKLSSLSKTRNIPKDGLTLSDFVASGSPKSEQNVDTSSITPTDTTFHMKTYGCQMNVSDSDIVRSLLLQHGMTEVPNEENAHVLLTNTCAIRENAEQKVWHRLRTIKSSKKKKQKQKQPPIVGVLGCMAERLKEGLLQDGLADLVVGPDAYRDLPKLIDGLLEQEQETAVNVQLSLEETYADVRPVRRDNENVSAFVSIMRGCNNMCSYCVVPFTRGRERSRPYDSIVQEIQQLLQEENPVREVILLGQNVNSYHDRSKTAVEARPNPTNYSTSNTGFTNLYRLRGGAGYYFSDLVEAVSDLDPELRVRFTSPHPKDYPPALLQLMSERDNVCSQLHLPAQSGNSDVLQRMRRGYTREAYLELIDTVQSMIPDVALSSDFIAGFCGETETEHEDTLSLMEKVVYDQAFLYAYSMRGKTHAHRTMTDNVPTQVKQRRLQELINVYRTKIQERNDKMEVGRLRLVLLEGPSRKSSTDQPAWTGRTDQNKRVVFPETFCSTQECLETNVKLSPGDYGVVEITEARGHTLRGQLLWRTTLKKFSELSQTQLDERRNQVMDIRMRNPIMTSA